MLLLPLLKKEEAVCERSCVVVGCDNEKIPIATFLMAKQPLSSKTFPIFETSCHSTLCTLRY